MRFQVPQNLDVPDTIFLGLNFKQLTYLGGALGFAVSLFLFAGGIGPTLLFGGPVLVLAVLLSFFSYNNQPFSFILQSLLRFVTRKKMYVWRQSDTTAQVAKKSPSAPADTDKASEPPSSGGYGPDKVGAINAGLVFDDDLATSGAEPDPVI